MFPENEVGGKLVVELTWCDECAEHLWQGKGIEMESTIDRVNSLMEEIVSHLYEMEKKGIVFPMEYVKVALMHLQEAIEARDDYLLADCIQYEIKEVATVYNEVISEWE